MTRLLGVLCGATALACAPSRVEAPSSSAAGWQPQILAAGTKHYLPDFSYAGYREGEAALPEPPATHAIADFGALPDDGQDDTAAFQSALATLAQAQGPVVLTLARGHYELSDVLFIERSDFVLRGAGSGADGSVLRFRKALADLPRAPVIRELETYLIANHKQVDGKPFSPFSWTGGLLWTRLPKPATKTAGAAALEGQRGARSLRVAHPPASHTGLFELRWFNRFGSDSPVLAHLFGLEGKLPGDRLADATAPLTSQALTLQRVEGDMLWFKEPLRHDVKPNWGAELAPAPLRLTGVGLEHFRVELPHEPYAGHHLERGDNGLYLTNLRDGFVRDVTIQDSDSAILSDDSDHLTLTAVHVIGRAGHYGIHLGDVDAVLARDFDIEAYREHSLSFNTGARGSVFSRGTIVDPRLDQHRGRNHQNLFDAIVGLETGDESRLFEHGGADYWGPTHGAFNTFWNISLQFRRLTAASATRRLSGVTDTAEARLVGLHANVALLLDYPGAYEEGTNRAKISVPSLYDEQLERRRQRARQSGSTP